MPPPACRVAEWKTSRVSSSAACGGLRRALGPPLRGRAFAVPAEPVLAWTQLRCERGGAELPPRAPPLGSGLVEGTRIILIRHGESRAQELGILGGHEGCQGLSDL